MERALDAFAADLELNPPAIDALPGRIRAYVKSHPSVVGAAVALLPSAGHVTYSPYVYRTGGVLVEKDLVATEPAIDSAAWLAVPRDTREAVWSEPYFDAGGAEIWMETRSVPLLRDDVVYAVATTDLPVSPPPD